MEKITLSQIRHFALTLIAIVLVGWTGYFIGKNEIASVGDVFQVIKSEFASSEMVNPGVSRNSMSEKADMTLFWQVWDKLQQDYLFQDRLDSQKLVYGAIQGMTSAAGDPYTAFYPPQENQTSKENLNGSFYGVGIQLGYKKGSQLAVIAPITGMPAEKQGVESGDYILKIKDENKGIDKDTYDMSLIEAVEIIRGEQGTEVTLTLLHEGATETYETTIKREEIIVPSVEVEFGKVVNDEFTSDNNDYGELVAHLKLTRFGELTDEQWDKSIEEILAKGNNVKGIVLDVRNNPGGYMQGAINLAAEFLPVGKVVVQQEQTKMPTQSFKTERFGRLLNIPMVVLMNQGSASASEILAAALNEHDRAKLVGTKSFGKGTIQSAEDYANDSGLHITIAKWLTPDGNWVHDKGIDPDVEVKLDPEKPGVDVQLVGAVQVLEGKEVTVGGKASEDNEKSGDYGAEEIEK